ncbi:MAG: efflux RND transporter periplasmic adaptor subunit [Bacteroidia bacterium]|nr:efflux RND transporter periplasmic adaptor subunit [Bacteroidia bacterium]
MGCQGKANSESEETDSQALSLSETQVAGAGIVIAPLQQRQVKETIRLIGRTMVLAHSQARAHSRVEGTIEAILIREGQYVQAGQELFRVYSASAIDLQRQYVEHHIRWRSTLRRLAIQETLFAQAILSQSELNQTRTELRQVQAQLFAIETQLRLLGIEPDSSGRIRLLSIRAPIAGYVTRVAVSMGEYIRPEQPLAYIVNLSDIHADLYISEKDLAWLREGMPVALRVPSLPQAGVLHSVIEYIVQTEDTGGRHLLAHVRVPPVSYPLFSGTPIEGTVEKERGKAFIVPREALGYQGGQAYVFTKEGSAYVPIPVKATFIDSIALIEGQELREGMPLVQKGGAFLAAQLWQVGKE